MNTNLFCCVVNFNNKIKMRQYIRPKEEEKAKEEKNFDEQKTREE